MDSFTLVPPGKLNDSLTDAVLRGVKIATSSLVVHDEMTGRLVEEPGRRRTLLDSDGRPVAIVEFTRTEDWPLGSETDALAEAEGDWFDGAAGWRAGHQRFFVRQRDEIRAHLQDPSWDVVDGIAVRTRWFRVVEIL